MICTSRLQPRHRELRKDGALESGWKLELVTSCLPTPSILYGCFKVPEGRKTVAHYGSGGNIGFLMERAPEGRHTFARLSRPSGALVCFSESVPTTSVVGYDLASLTGLHTEQIPA